MSNHSFHHHDTPSLSLMKGAVGIFVVFTCPFLLWFAFMLASPPETSEFDHNDCSEVQSEQIDTVDEDGTNLNKPLPVPINAPPMEVNNSTAIHYDDSDH
ncbi:hypothetical protein JO972_10805 [Verrucomicrobiaceae bacterium 5K15]|uniref:Transmembrane protein n=1 Tax=Oceaniferula flava TaxID=2800421 RepID=A0AAE2VCB1_9BACT|nr:hypothetical protein [Oceaniferula flavus]MBK1855450.1 hypothetical protein [Oceaniferula flavus]MBM1136756.1 hypothetical protein [Oceaniferula flavus]